MNEESRGLRGAGEKKAYRSQKSEEDECCALKDIPEACCLKVGPWEM